jgi:hypothetical protein
MRRALAGTGALALAAIAAAACTDADESNPAAPALADAAVAVSSAAAGAGRVFSQPPARPFNPNPLGLTAALSAVAPEQTVYAVPERMLASAKEGTSFALRTATVERIEGGNLIVRMGREPPYPVHPAYVVAAPSGLARRGSAVLTGFRGSLAHGLVVGLKRDLVIVRLLDAGPGYGDTALPRNDVSPQLAGLRPGNYAVLADGQRFEHVLLVSAGPQPGADRRWLVIGYAGVARVVPEAKLTALPLTLSAKVGATVAVPWLGTMVPAKVVAVDSVGLLTVRRPRATPAAVVGPGMVLEAAR